MSKGSASMTADGAADTPEVEKSLLWNVADYRKHAHEMVDFIADFYESIEKRRVLSNVKPGDIVGQVPESAPEMPESFDTIMQDVENIVMPGVTHWQSPMYFAYFPGNTSFASMTGDMLSSALAPVCFSWICSPAATELEMRMMDWLAELLQLPEEFYTCKNGQGIGSIQGTASEAVLVTLLAARERAIDRQADLSKLVAYVSTETHSSVQKACNIAAIPHLRAIATDKTRSMSVSALRDQIDQDRRDGLVPFFVCGTVGTTSTCAADPLDDIAGVLDDSIWLHCDAAYAGAFAVLPEMHGENSVFQLENVDSFCFNPHKSMLVTFDCSALFCKNRAALERALSLTPEYLRNKATDSGEVIDYRDLQVPLGRRFRALKLWFMLRGYGKEGVREHVRRALRHAEALENWLRENDFEIVGEPRQFGLVCFRSKRGSDFDRRQLAALNASGETWLTHTVIDGHYVVRCAFGGHLTRMRHVERLQQLLHQYFVAPPTDSEY